MDGSRVDGRRRPVVEENAGKGCVVVQHGEDHCGALGGSHGRVCSRRAQCEERLDGCAGAIPHAHPMTVQQQHAGDRAAHLAKS